MALPQRWLRTEDLCGATAERGACARAKFRAPCWDRSPPRPRRWRATGGAIGGTAWLDREQEHGSPASQALGLPEWRRVTAPSGWDRRLGLAQRPQLRNDCRRSRAPERGRYFTR